MPVSKKRRSPKTPTRAQSKRFLLPMPRQEADALCLQSRIALESVRGGRAGSHETTILAHTVLLTSFLTEAGHGVLDLSFVRQVEEAVLAILDAGKATGEWNFDETFVQSLTTVINEYDRQMREVRFGQVLAATKRLDRMIASVRTAR
ncbi:Fis family transcriptional regulator [Caballeronia jiangsuensis]|uniref:Fis family transcriptional regulator n=1 Tax=Caballeronia jiangsuensis TaxID=1458357 RepID=A0ABW9CTK7_9BURK